MKKLGLAFMAAAAVFLGFGVVAHAYPPLQFDVVANPSVVGPGGEVIVTATCESGELVTFDLEGDTDTDTCSGSSVVGASMLVAVAPVAGSASVTLNAPQEEGTYTASGTGSENGLLGTDTVTVVVEDSNAPAPAPQPGSGTPSGGGLPATGSSGIGTTTGIAIGLLVLGLGLFGVATFRRRQTTVA